MKNMIPTTTTTTMISFSSVVEDSGDVGQRYLQQLNQQSTLGENNNQESQDTYEFVAFILWCKSAHRCFDRSFVRSFVTVYQFYQLVRPGQIQQRGRVLGVFDVFTSIFFASLSNSIDPPSLSLSLSVCVCVYFSLSLCSCHSIHKQTRSWYCVVSSQHVARTVDGGWQNQDLQNNRENRLLGYKNYNTRPSRTCSSCRIFNIFVMEGPTLAG